MMTKASSTFSASSSSWVVKPLIQPVPARECEYCLGLHDEEDLTDEDSEDFAHPLYQDLDLKKEHSHFEEINISENMEEYITHLYVSMGSKTAYDALITFLGALESKDGVKTGYVYFMNNGVVTKQEYAEYLLGCIEDDLKKPKSSTKSDLSMENDNIEPSKVLVDYENIAAWNKLNTEAKEDNLLEEFLNPVLQVEDQTKKIYSEENVLSSFQSYKDNMKEERNLLKIRSKIIIQFAKNAVDWAHTHFPVPNLYNQQSIDAYIEERDLELKALMPEVSNYRLLTKKMKQYDSWEQLLSVIEVDHLAVGGSVTHEEQPLIFFDTPIEQ
ncbi:hypothetical protein G6F56_011088 [Rhizopus delemar]|nr:hypothetical protein G6F56_011088 [Rhizopus delemar]